MASAGIDTAKLTAPNWAADKISEILFLNVLSPKRMGQYVTVMRKQVNGKKVPLLGEFGAVGVVSAGCKPTYKNTKIGTSEKTWDIGEYQIAEEICYKDLKGTIAQMSLNGGTEVGNLEDTDYMLQVLKPRMMTAIEKTVFRLFWFGDKAAQAATSGGELATGVDPNLFKVNNGAWKQIYDIVGEHAARRVEIPANAEASFTAQSEAIAVKGVATGILNALINQAPMKLRQAEGKQILITQSLKDALDNDLIANNAGSALQWEEIFNGIQRSRYRGIEIIALPLWDEMIQGFQAVSDGLSWNKPYRALFTTKGNLLLGTESENAIAELETHFNRTTRMQELYASDTIGAMLADDEAFQVAY